MLPLVEISGMEDSVSYGVSGVFHVAPHVYIGIFAYFGVYTLDVSVNRDAPFMHDSGSTWGPGVDLIKAEILRL